MTSRVADRLSVARHQQFVGRAGEREFFRSTLAAAEWPYQLLFIFGPGGVGKTALLRELEYACSQAGAPATYLDVRNVEPSPDAFLHALRLALGADTRESPYAFLATRSFRSVLFFDTCEMLGPLDGWLREAFLPQLPDNTLVVMAGREPPSPAWHTDPGWQTLIRTLPLRNLGPDEARELMRRRSVPGDRQQAVLDFTHGHPLALSLVADAFAQRPEMDFQPEAAPDIVKALLMQFVQKVPGPAHRAALEACSMVRLMTEALLSAMLSNPEVHELFEWLRGLSFIESDRFGLFPHDLARDALIADVRWRNPDWYAELHRRAREHFTAHLQPAQGPEQRRLLYDLVFLHRDNPAVRPFFEWAESGALFTDSLRPGDAQALVEMVRRHEGDQSARIAAHWLARQPRGAAVFRKTTHEPNGFLMAVALDRADHEDRRIDAAARAAWAYLADRAPLRSGEVATLFRFWMDRDAYQAVSPTQSRAFISAVQHYLTTPGLAFTFFPCADPDFWAAVFAYADLARLPEADFEVGGRRYGVYGHDWRAVPPAAWLTLLADREVARDAAVRPASVETLLVLSESDFAAAVLGALRNFTRPDVLRANPLLRSRLVTHDSGLDADPARRVLILQDIVRRAAESLQASPRDAKLYRALQRTYLQPAPTQEKAAELLDLPFSTYRRHLKAGVARITELLWQREIGGA